LIKDLTLDYIVEEARNKTYHTSESLETLKRAIEQTETASKFYKEYNSSGKIFETLLEDLTYVDNLDLELYEKLDMFIQQDQVG
jgi:hypothetical protein